MNNKTAFIYFQYLTSILILLWSYTILSKLSDLETFKNQMHNQSFGIAFANVLIWLVPVTEIGTITLLLFKKTRMFGLACSLLLLTAFTIYVLLVLFNYYEHVPCNCGGVLKSTTWNTHLWFNLFFMGLNMVALLLGKRITTAIDKKIKT